MTAVFLKTGKPISLLVSQFFDVGPRGQRGFPTGVVLSSTIVPIFDHFLLIGHGPGLKKKVKKNVNLIYHESILRSGIQIEGIQRRIFP